MFGSTVRTVPYPALSEARKAHPAEYAAMSEVVFTLLRALVERPHNLHTLVPVTGYSSYRFSTFVLIEARDRRMAVLERVRRQPRRGHGGGNSGSRRDARGRASSV